MPKLLDHQIDEMADTRFQQALVGIESDDLCVVSFEAGQDLPEAPGDEIIGDEKIGKEGNPPPGSTTDSWQSFPGSQIEIRESAHEERPSPSSTWNRTT